jgi:alcohol dehydrogenase
VLNGGVKPGDTVVVVGAGPVGLAAILNAKLYGPGRIVAVDLANSRLESARQLGSDETVNSSSGSPVEQITEMTDGLGADVVMEAVGVPETFELCTEKVRPGGRVANIGVHGHPVTLHLETLWIKSVTIATGLVDASSTSTLLKLVSEGRLDTTPLATHRFVRHVRRPGEHQITEGGPLGLKIRLFTSDRLLSWVPVSPGRSAP